MKKIFLLFFAIILFSGCEDKSSSNFIYNMAMNCYVKVYESKDGTRVYSEYNDIKYKINDTEISIQEALDKNIINLSDLENNHNFKIYEQGEEKCLTCCD